MRLRLFGDLETIGTVGDIVKMCPPSFSLRWILGVSKLRYLPPNLADSIHKRILFIQNVSR